MTWISDLMGRTTIEETVRLNLEAYFRDLGESEPSDIYDMVIRAAEKPMLEIVMARACGNQSRAAAWLGMHRNTLHKKLQEHKLFFEPPL